jgi:hypothetical protein
MQMNKESNPHTFSSKSIQLSIMSLLTFGEELLRSYVQGRRDQLVSSA